MLNEFLQMLMGGGGQTPAAPTPVASPMPQPGAQMPMQGPPMPAYMQNLSPAPGANPAQAQDERQRLIMKMLQQGMFSQGQGQQQAPQVPPMAMSPGRPGGQMPMGSQVANLMQRSSAPTMMPRRPLGMF